MICVLKMEGAEIKGWILAYDTRDAARKAYAAGEQELANYFYSMFHPPLGKTILPTGHVMIVG